VKLADIEAIVRALEAAQVRYLVQELVNVQKK
jgi:hypothetical protein